MEFLDTLLEERTADNWIEQGTPEWEKVRIGRFTASEIFRLMEPAKREMTEAELKARPKSGKGSTAKLVNDYSKLSDAALTYIYEKVAEELTGRAQQQGYAFPIVHGNTYEEEAAEYFAQKTGFELQKTGFYKYTTAAGGSPDRLVNNDGILEIKAPFNSVNQVKYLMLTDEYDLRREYFPYWCQVQCNMMFADRSIAHFVTYDFRMKVEKMKMQHIKVKPDLEFHNLVRKKIAQATEEKLKIIQLLS
jgi:hypothetical protein